VDQVRDGKKGADDPMTTRACMHCEADINPPHLLCVKCWFSLPPRVKAAVQERLRGWRAPDAAREIISSYYYRNERKGII
jgi:hypothetical protein